MVVKITPDPTLQNNLMAFGFEFSSGWNNLMRNLIAELNQLPEEIEFIQVKEKYGRLCVYVNGANEIAYDIILKYERLSETVCENCGSPGKIMEKNRWLKTVCERCARDNDYNEIGE